MTKYKAIIGLEMHCELKSNSKVFSSAENSYSEIVSNFFIELNFTSFVLT